MSGPVLKQKRNIQSMEDAVGGAQVSPANFQDAEMPNFTNSKAMSSDDDYPALTPDQAYKMNALEDIGYSGSTDRSQLKKLSPDKRNDALQSMYQDASAGQDFMEAKENSPEEDAALDRFMKTKALIGG